MTVLYLVCGITLVVAFVGVIVYYFAPKRKDDVEAAKYEMLNDYDKPIVDDPEDDGKKE